MLYFLYYRNPIQNLTLLFYRLKNTKSINQ